MSLFRRPLLATLLVGAAVFSAGAYAWAKAPKREKQAEREGSPRESTRAPVLVSSDSKGERLRGARGGEGSPPALFLELAVPFPPAPPAPPRRPPPPRRDLSRDVRAGLLSLPPPLA
jgi:hypothetical protein